jgi:hypothetical protein
MCALVLVGLVWVFYPAIACRNEKLKPKQNKPKDEFLDINGAIIENDQLFSKHKCDISIVVPAYNEVYCPSIFVLCDSFYRN